METVPAERLGWQLCGPDDRGDPRPHCPGQQHCGWARSGRTCGASFNPEKNIKESFLGWGAADLTPSRMNAAPMTPGRGNSTSGM